MKLLKFLSDIKLGFYLLQREGFKSFWYRFFWYLRGQRLKEDIFEKKGNGFQSRWMIENPTAIIDGPLISVIVPLYNHEKFIEQGLKSIMDQTYKNIEIIVIDDGSTDNSYKVATNILKSGTRPFICMTQKNQGAHATINRGIAKAKGKYIAILNSDDYFAINRFSFLIGSLEQSTSEIAFSGVSYIDENNQQIDEQKHDLVVNFSRKQKYAAQFPTAGFALMDFNFAISTGNFVFTKSLYQKIGGFRDLKFCHDWDFILQSLRFAEPLFITQKLYFYRFHGDNTFLKLQKILPTEHKKVLSSFLKIPQNKILNAKFPNQKNYPDYFPCFIKKHGYKKYLTTS